MSKWDDPDKYMTMKDGSIIDIRTQKEVSPPGTKTASTEFTVVRDAGTPNQVDTGKKPDKKPDKKPENENKTTGKDIAKAGADAAGVMAAAHRQSWSGYKGGSTGVVDSSKNMTAARGPSDVLSKAERKRLEQLTGGYG